MGSDLYRLKWRGKVVGYRKQVGSYAFFSRDDFWYNGSELPFDLEQPYTGVKDRRGRKLFVGDVVRTEVDGHETTLLIRSMTDQTPRLCCSVTFKDTPLADPMLTLSRSLFLSIGQ